MTTTGLPPGREHGTGGTGRSHAERRAASQRRLLDVTAELIAERGTSGVGFGEIAKAAGCSHGLPSYLFGTKAGLLRALVDDFAARFRSAGVDSAVADATGLEALVVACDAFVRILAGPGPETRAAYVLLGEALGSNAELRTTLNGFDAAMRRVVARWIAQGIEAGEIRPGVDPDLQATVLLGAIRGVGQQVVADSEAFDLAAVRTDLVESVIRMIAADPDRAVARWASAQATGQRG